MKKQGKRGKAEHPEHTKQEIIAKLKGEIDALKEEVKADVVVPVVASFGFIIALIWRDAIQEAIKEFLSRAGLLEKAYLYQFISAIIVTIIVIIIMVVVTELGRAKKRRKIEKAIEKKIEIIKKKKKS